MIVEIFVPALNRSYDIQTRENNTPERLTEEVLQLLQYKLGEEEEGLPGSYGLYQYSTGTLLENLLPLYQQGVNDGSRLILV